MINAEFIRDRTVHAADDDAATVKADGARFTAGQFFREAGAIIAVCLALGLIIQLVLG